jgi:hypothetical protein
MVHGGGSDLGGTKLRHSVVAAVSNSPGFSSKILQKTCQCPPIAFVFPQKPDPSALLLFLDSGCIYCGSLSCRRQLHQ